MTDNSITVIGSGATALAAAAYLTIKGKQVILCDREQGQRFRDIEDGGGITLEGVMETGSPVLPFRMTDDFQDAVGNARRILVCVSADRHREIADLCSPYAREGQTYVISPGNLGAVIFVDRFYKKGKKGVTAAELVGNICPCRITGRARVTMRSKGFSILVRPRALLASFITALSSASSSAGLRDIRPASGKANV